MQHPYMFVIINRLVEDMHTQILKITSSKTQLSTTQILLLWFSPLSASKMGMDESINESLINIFPSLENRLTRLTVSQYISL